MNIEIRRAVPRDVPALLALIQAHATYEHGHASIGPGQLTALLATERSPVAVWIASTPDLVGYAALTTDFSLWRGSVWVHLDCLFVDEAYRGAGVGRQLLAHAREIARAAGADRLEWQTPAWNERAIHFYEREGGIAAHKVRFSISL